ncbi:hypothetical protein PRK78_005416 [Emydomyces testavorans]|uniref:Uncharacterized protein n=1 Tax=Emydomyces testavorans TaxID=2070801 RepID=A0AAF0DJI1_9EURO|nr:hypothetical protein PRK78_005416 [Emydomyces testavorans]
MAAGSGAIDAAIQSFLSLPAAIAAIYGAVGDRRIARSDFGFAIVDWTSYMVSIEPYIRRGLGYRDIELQARRILDLCAWLGWWLYSIGFRQSHAVAKKHTIRSLQFPCFWLNKKYKRFEVKLDLIKGEGERLKQTLLVYTAGQPRVYQIQSPVEDQPLPPCDSTPPVSSLKMINESAKNLNSVSTCLLKQ